jgi:IS5 family transposase
VATTLKEGLVVGMRSMPGNPWDGHTLAETVEQASILTYKVMAQSFHL